MQGTYFVFADKPALAHELISFGASAGKRVCAIALEEGQAQGYIYHGAGKVLVLKGSNDIPESYAKAMATLLKKEGAEVFLVGATVRGRELAARVAGYLDWAMVSDVSSLRYGEEGELVTERLMYGGAVLQVEAVRGPAVITVPGGKFEGRADETRKGEITSVEVEADPRVVLLERTPIEKQGADLAIAEKIVGVGMGFAKQEDLKLAEELAQTLGAELGCSRGVAEERKWLPADLYIGISGATVKPRLYLSFGISGQVQHIVGVRDAKIIAAVDINENAPIFQAADYGIVGDLYEILPLLTAAVKKIKQ
ncbi:electron transfer flavoprotein subunit alpha/FixB family protein [Thermanaeromonas sp. C210]|uniref:electron transfer flavoprotein subunit alpha/FixB family protein n=1 Tax=Thermanaeromonas sp. C210 TaxID=2731925 RepID=UPI00155D2398|nr:electron transfer flavoprotein subunit alpha/FixB family protein [Thermanaeromonas sp. C210]GFN23553.1 electron transfer flavoprotein subunit alpha [Thermanaeromonas sp. C210]